MPVIALTERIPALLDYKAAVHDEWIDILSWWSRYMPDEKEGGFYGSVDQDNIPDIDAPKGIVLNSRICWTFSTAYTETKNEAHLQMATRAFEYILHHFVDHEYGGVYWSVDAQGKMLDGRKQIYGQAFCLYGLAAYYKATGEGLALHLAKDLFEYIELHSLDKEKEGYVEAFTREWLPSDDLRLSEKDDNEKKTMNTHLHIIEAYASLYSIWPDTILREKIASLLEVFDRHFINKENFHLHLFLDENWNLRSSLVSYGHDIEAAWLLLECAEVINYKLYIDHYRQLSVKLADAAAKGLDSDGGLWYEYEPAHDRLVKEKHSWPQAEAMIGFFNAWQLTGDYKYLQYSKDSFAFIKNYIKDDKAGEWRWGIKEDGSPMEKEKAGFWKCPYHSARACMEIQKRISSLSY
jgi:mannobiose 2-epimerase